VIREDISKGQRVREYSVEAKLNGKWELIASGISIGNKRIQEIDAVNAKVFRLKITRSIKEALVKEFSLYHIYDEGLRVR